MTPETNDKTPFYDQLVIDVLEQATRDAAKGDPIAGAWLLSDEADLYAQAAGLDDGFLGTIAGGALERLANGIR